MSTADRLLIATVPKYVSAFTVMKRTKMAAKRAYTYDKSSFSPENQSFNKMRKIAAVPKNENNEFPRDYT